MYNSILFIGYPGTGKTSIGKHFDSKHRYKHYSNGEELRELSKKDNLNPIISNHMNKGLPIPANLLIEEMKKIIKRYIKDNSFDANKDTLIIDGLPRDEAQLKELRKICHIKKVFLFTVKNKKILIDRILKNRNEKRKDDSNIGTIMKRIQVIDDNLASILNHFDRNQIIEIDSENMDLNQIIIYINQNL